MSDVPLAHLSRQQLVQLLLRIVDLLAQPVLPFHTVAPAPGTTGGPALEPYDASLDPWNDPALCLPAGCGQNEGAPSCPRACYDSSSGLPRLALFGSGHPPLAREDQATRGGCLPPPSGPSCENALPGCAPWVHVCGGLCGVCGAPCVLQHAGHSAHLCALHKIP